MSEKTKKTKREKKKEYNKSQENEAAKIEMVSKLAKRQKEGKFFPKNTDGTKATDTRAALNKFKVQKIMDKEGGEYDGISDPNLSEREGSFKSGGRVKLRGGGICVKGMNKKAYGANS